MARYCGIVGYVESVETSVGVWTDNVTERLYRGDAVRTSSRWSTSTNSTNDDLTINVQLSVIADPFAYQNFNIIKYAEYMGVKWKVTSIDVERPRLILTLGGEYNGK